MDLLCPSVLLLSREAVCASGGKEPLNHVVPVSFVKLRHSTGLLTQSSVPWRPEKGNFHSAVVVNSWPGTSAEHTARRSHGTGRRRRTELHLSKGHVLLSWDGDWRSFCAGVLPAGLRSFPQQVASFTHTALKSPEWTALCLQSTPSPRARWELTHLQTIHFQKQDSAPHVG